MPSSSLGVGRWVLTWFFPTLLLAQAVLPVALVAGRLLPFLWAFHPEMNLAGEQFPRAAAITVTVLFATTWLLWVVPLLYCLWSHHWVARRLKPISAPAGQFMQVQAADGPASYLRRFCSKCQIDQGDRVYHCGSVGKCLPYYDHTCYWWRGAVWLHNVKAYLYFILFLPVHQLCCIGFSIWVLANSKIFRQAEIYTSVGIVPVLGFVPSLSVAYQFWAQIGLHNVLLIEAERLGTIHVRINDHYVYSWDAKEESKCPWSFGKRQNLLRVLGPVKSWLFFWSETPLIRSADQYPIRGLPGGSIPLASLPVNRRDQVSSTGFEGEVEHQSRSTLSHRSSSKS